MSATLYLEGGGDTRLLKTACREGFSKLLARSGFRGRMPQLVACGSRNAAFDDFKNAHLRNTAGKLVAMLIDSEEPMADADVSWSHLSVRDGWQRPSGASDDQVLLMTTCMETWIVADRATLAERYGHELQTSALPSVVELENRPREAVQQALNRATRNCTNRYVKGPRSYEVLAKLAPSTLAEHLPSFSRACRILAEKL